MPTDASVEGASTKVDDRLSERFSSQLVYTHSTSYILLQFNRKTLDCIGRDGDQPVWRPQVGQLAFSVTSALIN